jgi:hypothetical protein
VIWRLRKYGLAGLATLALAAGILPLFPTGASSTPTRTLAALELRARFRDTLNEESCPLGAPVPAQVECFRFDGDGVVPGLGKATVTWQLIDDLTDGLTCQHFNFTTVVVKVRGKARSTRRSPIRKRTAGRIRLSWLDRSGARSPEARGGTQEHRAICRPRRT